MISIAPETGVSQIDELNHSLKALNKRQGVRDSIALAIIALFWIPISVGLFRNMGAEICGGWLGLTILYFVSISSFYYFVQSRTRLRFQITQLAAEVDRQKEHLRLEDERIASEKESIAIDLLNKIKLEIETRKSEMLGIEAEIKYKRKWRGEFSNFPLVLERNWELDQAGHKEIRRISQDIRKGHSEYSKWNRINLYPGLGRGLFWPFGYENYRWLRWRLQSMKAWQPPEFISPSYTAGETSDRYEDNDELHDKKGFSKVLSDEKTINDTEFEKTVAEPRDKSTLRNHSKTVLQPDFNSDEIDTIINRNEPSRSLQVTLFDEISLTQMPIAKVPKQHTRLPKRRVIKISDELRRQVEEHKIKIGRLGELAVMEHERSRLRNEQGGLTREIEHVSLTNDAAGYDIRSWDGQNEIYIEVKTTVGDFWSNLFFTENEHKTLGKLKEKFYLYRVCNFNLERGEGQLFIYAGEELITDTFEFNSKMYQLSEKSH